MGAFLRLPTFCSAAFLFVPTLALLTVGVFTFLLDLPSLDFFVVASAVLPSDLGVRIWKQKWRVERKRERLV